MRALTACGAFDKYEVRHHLTPRSTSGIIYLSTRCSSVTEIITICIIHNLIVSTFPPMIYLFQLSNLFFTHHSVSHDCAFQGSPCPPNYQFIPPFILFSIALPDCFQLLAPSILSINKISSGTENLTFQFIWFKINQFQMVTVYEWKLMLTRRRQLD